MVNIPLLLSLYIYICVYIYIYIPGGAGFLPSTVAPENGWLDDEFPFGESLFSGANC